MPKSAIAARQTSGSEMSNGNKRPLMPRPIANISGSATRNTMPFAAAQPQVPDTRKRPGGEAQQHEPTRACLFSGGSAHGRLVYLTRSARRSTRRRPERESSDAHGPTFDGVLAGRPFKEQRRRRWERGGDEERAKRGACRRRPATSGDGDVRQRRPPRLHTPRRRDKCPRTVRTPAIEPTRSKTTAPAADDR